MTTGATVEVEGAAMFAATLHTAANGLSHLDTATRQTGELLRTRAAGRAPKRSGALARSIRADSDGESVSVGSGLIYAPVIHFGWAAHGISPNPFLVPVAADSESLWMNFYVADVQSKLDKVRGA